ncbi:MAG TPA: hypothetical protein VNT28_06000 [Candidatus Limnocylindrales bacterium]|nr:hypothetical protein [Candidatus Limnocylindrales bacterium]
MIGFVRFALFFGVVVALIVVVALPALASPFLTRMVRDAGVHGGELNVTIGMFDPSIIEGRAGQLRIEGRGVTIGPATVGGIDLTLIDASYFDRSFAAVRGNLRDVELTAGGIRVAMARMEIDGPSEAAAVSGHFTPAQGADIVRQAARRAGVALDRVEFVDGDMRVTLGGMTARAGVAVEGGALVLRPVAGAPAVLLIQPAPSDPWRLTDAWVSPDGITVRGVVDAATIARRATAAP